MPKRKRKSQIEDAMDDVQAAVMGLARLYDALFLHCTGKNMMDNLKELGRRPRELPQGEKVKEKVEATAESDMPLEWAYSILGLKPGASLEEVKKNYRNLSRAFHSDKGSVMNDEAMKLLNRAFDRITKRG